MIISCILTRNKERIYDIDYDDGTKLYGVREEYIRLISNSKSTSNHRLQEGMRVHAKLISKNR